MTRIVTGTDQIDIPADAQDFESFRQWLHSGSFPEKGKICFIKNQIWVDLMEELYSHNQVRTEIGAVLHSLVRRLKYGRYLTEGMRYSHPETNLSTEPDGMIISDEAIETGRVRCVGGKDGDETELIGSPDIVIEVVSKSSVEKDTEWAVESYFDAGIPEYWLVDVRDEDDLQFQIHKRGQNGYVQTRKVGGWVKSGVLGKSFRLLCSEDKFGRNDFSLEVR